MVNSIQLHINDVTTAYQLFTYIVDSDMHSTTFLVSGKEVQLFDLQNTELVTIQKS